MAAARHAPAAAAPMPQLTISSLEAAPQLSAAEASLAADVAKQVAMLAAGAGAPSDDDLRQHALTALLPVGLPPFHNLFPAAHALLTPEVLNSLAAAANLQHHLAAAIQQQQQKHQMMMAAAAEAPPPVADGKLASAKSVISLSAVAGPPASKHALFVSSGAAVVPARQPEAMQVDS
jgi:hypothetical protein